MDGLERPGAWVSADTQVVLHLVYAPDVPGVLFSRRLFPLARYRTIEGHHPVSCRHAYLEGVDETVLFKNELYGVANLVFIVIFGRVDLEAVYYVHGAGDPPGEHPRKALVRKGGDRALQVHNTFGYFDGYVEGVQGRLL